MRAAITEVSPGRGRLDLGWGPYLPHQARFVRWEPRNGARHTTEAILGGWGSGKTTAAVRRVLRLALQLRRTADYGRSEAPTVLVGAPTSRVLRDATWAKLEAAIPPALVSRKRAFPTPEIELVTGVRILGYSAEAELEGVDAAIAYLDEIAHPAWAQHERRYLNWTARLRDARAPRRAMIVSGLPESGWVRDTFDVQDQLHRHTLLCGTKDNWFLPESMLQTFLEACPSGYQEAYIEGRWMPPQHAVYPQYAESLHVVAEDGDPRQPVHLGIDVGNYGAIVVAQERLVRLNSPVAGSSGSDKGLLIVDEMLTENLSLDRMLIDLRTQRPWQHVASVAIDPTTRKDEMAALRRHFPSARVIKWQRGDDYYDVETGIRCVQRALRDALENVRLVFAASLKGRSRGVLDAIQRYRRNPASQLPVKDNLRDHVQDALRYVVCGQLPTHRGEFGTLRYG